MKIKLSKQQREREQTLREAGYSKIEIEIIRVMDIRSNDLLKKINKLDRRIDELQKTLVNLIIK